MNTAIVTDSNSGITTSEARELRVFLVPMPFFIGGELYYEGRTLTHAEFFRRQREGAEISTSQPTPGDVMSVWDEALKEHDELVYIPMSSSLSGACATARVLAEDYDGRVKVADNLRISATQRVGVLDALRMAAAGLSAEEICSALEREKLGASIYIRVDTLKYLRQGGRITPAAAAFGTALGIKPVLQIQGGKLDALTMAHSIRGAKRAMLDATERDLNTRFAGARDVRVEAAYSCSAEESDDWAREIRERFGERFDGYIAPLSLSIACHTGPGAFGVGCVKGADY